MRGVAAEEEAAAAERRGMRLERMIQGDEVKSTEKGILAGVVNCDRVPSALHVFGGSMKHGTGEDTRGVIYT